MSNTAFSSFSKISFDKAMEVVNDLIDMEVFEVTAASVYSGKHVDLGEVKVFVPMAGESILIAPVATQ